VESQQLTLFIVFGLTLPGLESAIYNTRGEHANHYATEAVHLGDIYYIYRWYWDESLLHDNVASNSVSCFIKLNNGRQVDKVHLSNVHTLLLYTTKLEYF
jgi:hypothetical protein